MPSAVDESRYFEQRLARADSAISGKTWLITRPVISCSSRSSSASATSSVATRRPSRSTVTRSPMRPDLAHAVGDVDDADAPGASPARSGANRRSVSRSVSEAVGSSRISTERSVRNALAISTICCSARVRSWTRWRGRNGKPSRSRISSARRCSARLVEKAAARQLGAEEQVLLDGELRHQREFLEHGADAERAGLMHALQIERLAAEADAAGGRACTPASIWIRVDLPAPFSPNRTCTSPGAQLEIDPVERQYAGKLLGYGLGLQNRRGRGRPRVHAFRWRQCLRRHHTIERPHPSDVSRRRRPASNPPARATRRSRTN